MTVFYYGNHLIGNTSGGKCEQQISLRDHRRFYSDESMEVV